MPALPLMLVSMPRARVPLLVACLGWLAAACQVAAPPDQAGMGLPVQLPGEVYQSERSPLSGTLHVTDTGCDHAMVDGRKRYVIWPAGSAKVDGVRLPDGSVLADGDPFEGVGGLTPVEPLTADRNGWWAHTIGFCDPEATEVLVLDEARPTQ